MRIGSLCSGYGGLDMAVEQVYGGELAWVSDIDKGACKILAHRFPDVPNIGDFTKTDWADVEPVDILCAGFPCQPVSHAGKQLGDEDERWLWDDVLRAVREVRPGVVVLENVRGLLTARDGELFGRVLGGLADIGYDASWHGIKAADVGAPHGRFRVFITATDADGAGRREHGRPFAVPAEHVATEHTGADALLPTPNPFHAGNTETPDEWLERRAEVQERTGTRHGPALGVIAQSVVEGHVLIQDGAGPRRVDPGIDRWGPYAQAVHRWEALTARPAPVPTEAGPNGGPRLAASFVEWLMGLPMGWVVEVPGLTRNEQLKALGNGVVPQQAAEALRVMASWEMAA